MQILSDLIILSQKNLKPTVNFEDSVRLPWMWLILETHFAYRYDLDFNQFLSIYFVA